MPASRCRQIRTQIFIDGASGKYGESDWILGDVALNTLGELAYASPASIESPARAGLVSMKRTSVPLRTRRTHVLASAQIDERVGRLVVPHVWCAALAPHSDVVATTLDAHPENMSSYRAHGWPTPIKPCMNAGPIAARVDCTFIEQSG